MSKPFNRPFSGSLSFLIASMLVLTLAGCPTMPTDDGDGGGTGSGADAQIVALEDDAHAGINTERTSRSVAALTMREDMRLVARAHSEDMVAQDFFAHSNPDGEDAFDRMANAGISYQTAGENIAWNNFSTPVTTAVDGWMNSEGHRTNILNGAFTHTGMGVAGDGNGGYYFTQIFLGDGKSDAQVVKFYLPPPLAIDVGAH
jgi:uncharacterized protein YkwD